MPNTNLKNFKGLAQHIVYEELNPDYCHTLTNLDIDNPVGRLSKRGGYIKKYADAFTDLISAFEYKFPTSAETILIFNDNGTLKRYVGGGSLASLSLPSGATLEANFRNQYFGFKDHIQITTGNGATNFVLGYYYTKRLAASNEGLFGNSVEDTGTYRLLKSQIMFDDGMFNRVYNIVQLGTYYYISFQTSKWIEKRNSSWQLVEKFIAHEDAADNTTVALAADATYLYIGTEDGVYKVNPNGRSIVDSSTAITGIRGLAVDADYVFAISETDIYRFAIADFTTETHQTHVANFYDITCEPSSGGAIYTLNSSALLERYVKNDFADGNETHNAAVTGTPKHIVFDNVNNYVVVPGGTFVKRYTDNTLTLVDTNTFTGFNLQAIMPDFKVIDDDYGSVYPFNSQTPTYPNLFTMAIESFVTGDIELGTVFYKIAIEDTEGNFFISSDPIFATLFTSYNKVNLRISCNDTLNTQLYRIKYIHIFRAYNSDNDEETPATNYKFLKTIDINDQLWANDTNRNLWYYAYADNTPEATISSVTYEEMSGFSENAKPRYVNYKVSQWINEQLHCANFYVDGTTYKNKIVVSQVNGPDVVPFVDTYDFDPYDGDEIKNIATAYSRAYIMKNKRTGIFYDNVQERILNYGIADTDSYFIDQDVIYLVSDKGIFVVNGVTVEQINDPVITYFSVITSFTDASVFLRDDLNRLLFTTPNDRTLVWNRKYNTWTYYGSSYAFNGYFKNLSNEYIAFGRESSVPNAHYFWKLDDSAQDNGSDIAITYESPLLKIEDADGFHQEATHVHLRQKSTGTFYVNIYDWRKDSKVSGLVFTIEDLTTMSNTVKMITDLWGEAFSIGLSGSGTVFQLASMTLLTVPAGLAEEMV